MSDYPMSEWTNMKRAGELPFDGVYLVMPRAAYEQFACLRHAEECGHPGCSGRHLLMADPCLAANRPPRAERAARLRMAGHKHARAAYRRARALKGDAK